eukprot:gnl/MRDRNA2_/MRDRNA2_215174_c0_seq1.p1 gnl/MRDRNA2_/MRDRNA2_215174_c0~~gnl/MRDRNA2_/MRDRNA2_215174_c0_seq1.p1  ORF type:complete len:492 (+),score=81.93 gnl/MRDRNA2_/MRDRNA2_215174_c0_seq1:154-1476(+)
MTNARAWAFTFAFWAAFSFWSIRCIAMEIEQPFGNNEDHIDFPAQQEGMNHSLMQLLDQGMQAAPEIEVARSPVSDYARSRVKTGRLTHMISLSMNTDLWRNSNAALCDGNHQDNDVKDTNDDQNSKPSELKKQSSRDERGLSGRTTGSGDSKTNMSVPRSTSTSWEQGRTSNSTVGKSVSERTAVGKLASERTRIGTHPAEALVDIEEGGAGTSSSTVTSAKLHGDAPAETGPQHPFPPAEPAGGEGEERIAPRTLPTSPEEGRGEHSMSRARDRETYWTPGKGDRIVHRTQSTGAGEAGEAAGAHAAIAAQKSSERAAEVIGSIHAPASAALITPVEGAEEVVTFGDREMQGFSEGYKRGFAEGFQHHRGSSGSYAEQARVEDSRGSIGSLRVTDQTVVGTSAGCFGESNFCSSTACQRQSPEYPADAYYVTADTEHL